MRSSEAARTSWTGVLAAALLLLLAACQPLPQPFADRRPDHNPLLELPDSGGVAMSRIAGLDEDSDAAVRQILIEAFEAENVPAMLGAGTRASFRLAASAASARPNGAGIVATALTWHLLRDREPLLVLERRIRFLNGKVLAEDRPLLASVARQAARVMQADSPAALAGAEKPTGMRLMVPPVTGAPGDGPTALARAMTGFLRGKGIAADTGEPGPDTLRLAGKVEMGKPKGGQQLVEITWTLLAPDGREVGTIGQSNPVPVGSLDGKWGEIADFAAEAAADGVMALIQQAQRAGAGVL